MHGKLYSTVPISMYSHSFIHSYIAQVRKLSVPEVITCSFDLSEGIQDQSTLCLILGSTKTKGVEAKQ